MTGDVAFDKRNEQDGRRPVVVAVVPSEGVERRQSIDYRFMLTAEVPAAYWGLPWGLLTRASKSSDYVNPFRLARGEPGAVGDDGVPRWELFLGQDGQQIFFGAVDDDLEGRGLASILEDVPDCVVLVGPADAEALVQSGAADVQLIPYEGSLATSG